MSTRRWFAAAALIAALLIPACGGAPSRKWTTPVLDVDCGGNLKLHFEERGEFMGFPAGAQFFDPVLLMDNGSGWKTVATLTGASPSAYSSLLPANARLHRFEKTKSAAEGSYHRRAWPMYIDPAVVSDAQYDRVCACLDANLASIDAAWDKPRDPNENFELSTERRPWLESAVHIAYDPRFVTIDRTTLGVRWECPDGSFIKTEPPHVLSWVSIKDDVTGVIGWISDDQKHAELFPESKVGLPALRRTSRGRQREYYGTCRDARGRSLYETLAPAEWKER